MKPVSYGRRLWSAIALLLLLLWGASFLEVRRSEREQLHEGHTATAFQSQAFAENTLASIKRLNELLLDLRSNWTGDWDVFSDTVRMRQQHISDISLQVAVIDADGILAYSNLARATRRVDLRERVHYRVHASDPTADRLYISNPVKGKVSGRWSIQFTRPIFVKERFAGVLVVSVSPDIFASFHSKLNLGPGGITSMVKDSGEILARYPGNESYLGKTISGDFLKPEAGVSGSLRRISQIDGTDRIYGYYKLPEYGLAFIVGRAVDELMAPQQRHRHLVLTFAGAVSLVILVLGLWLFRAMQSREQAGRALFEAQAQQRLLGAAVSQSNASVVVTDLSGRIVFVNDAFTRITGYPAAEVLGQTPRILKSGLTDPRIFEEMWQVIGSGKAWEGELQNRRKDGRIYWESGTISPVFDEANRISHFIAVKEDISDKKVQEVELRNAKERAEAANVAKSQFLANMSHEIRTPLNGILGMAYIGQRESRGQPRLQGTFTQILKSGRTLLGVIDDILDFSRLEADKLHVERRTLLIGEVIDGAIKLLESDYADKAIELTVHRAPDLPVACLGDSLRLGQVLVNLLSNALKFTPAGTVRLEAGCDGEQLVFRVTDTGIGMNEQQLARIFSPFEQADSSHTRRYGGTGLGLSITRRIVDLMGGTIEVVSEPGKGSTFTVRLPFERAPLKIGDAALESLAAARPATEASDGAPAAVPSAEVASAAEAGTDAAPSPELDSIAGRLDGFRLLLAEDDPVNKMVIEDYLVEAGAQVVSVENGADAVNRIESGASGRFDAVLMDIQMPVMNGHEATRQIHRVAPALPVIGQTAHAFEQEREACFASGMVAHICKPIDPVELVDTVRRHATRASID
ncbi:MAG: response regulator [Rhodocyclaceae bacterium]|nr:response regulator [Rhodocyclaceae bacterium]